MDTTDDRQGAALDAIKKLMATRIKLDIAATVRANPNISAERTQEVFNLLANDETVDGLVRDLAREEVEAAIARGQLPSASFLHLAGYKRNQLGEG